MIPQIQGCFAVIFAILFHVCLHVSNGQIADPVKPIYDHSAFSQFFLDTQMPNHASVDELMRRLAVGLHKEACMTRTNIAHSTHNVVFVYGNKSEMPFNWTPDSSLYIENNTYWFNEDLHVGHVHYDIVLMQVLESMRIDRIIMQRSVCRANICNGIGSIESFYKGYFAALFEAFGQPNIPVYIRYDARQRDVKPLYFSAHTDDYFNPKLIEQEKYQSIELKPMICFELVVRSGKKHTYGALPTVSASAVQAFKATAYKMIRADPPLTTYFQEGAPYRILFAYRGPSATRHIENIDDFIGAMQRQFRPPQYIFRLLNTSDPQLDFKTQLQAVGESHVVIANHGAFEGNMIYMKNSSLLLEIFGNYGNNEIHTFHRLALMFGIFYARAHPKGLVHHLNPSYNITDEEIKDIVGTVQEYFDVKAYRFNMK